MDKKVKEIEEVWNKEFSSDWIVLQRKAEQFLNKSLDLATIGALCRTYYLQACRMRQENIEHLLSRIKELQRNLDREITYRDALEQAEEKIKELEERIQLAESTRDDALAYAKGYKSELDRRNNEI